MQTLFFFIHFYFINTYINTSRAVSHDLQTYKRYKSMKCIFFMVLKKEQKKGVSGRFERECEREIERERGRERERESCVCVSAVYCCKGLC